MIKLKCKKCGHEWLPRCDAPKECPRCKNPKWNEGQKRVKK